MTELLEQAIKRARTLPDDQQDELARVLLRLADAEQEPVPLSADERAAIAASKAAAARGEFATDEEVRAVWASYGL
jgi:predicted transcriptional regulator